MMRLGELPRYWRTLRHLKPSQVAWRIRYRVEEKLQIGRRALDAEGPSTLEQATVKALRAYAAEAARRHPPTEAEIDELRQNRFRFLNVTVHNPAPMMWDPADVSRLWLYNLHYFDCARTLALANAGKFNQSDLDLLLSWVNDWIEHNPVGQGVGWHAFVVSSRLMNWSLAFSVFGHAGDVVRHSMAQQTAYLLTHLEYDVLANHLLKNAQALVVAGCILGSDCAIGRDALTQGLALLDRELAEQILPDGGHYEGSLMYHCHVLDDCLMVHAALREKPGFLRDAIAHMADFLAQALHADEDIPLFGDAALNTGMPPRALMALASDLCGTPALKRAAGCYALESSGLYVMEREDAGARLIVKAGLPAPGYQMGHSHCDLLSYELTVGSRRFIVDSGVMNYESGPWRAYCRSTRAHNTVRVDGGDQLECWDAFRVGRRCRPEVHKWEPDRDVCLRASHDGYRPYSHERSVFFCRNRFWVFVDTITGPALCQAESFIHFHPDIRIEQDEGLWRARLDDMVILLRPFGADSAEVVRGREDPLQGWHCPEFGRAEPADCLILARRRTCPVTFGYAIFPDPADTLTGEELAELVDLLMK